MNFLVLFENLFSDFKSRYRVGQQIRGTDLITLKSVLCNSPFDELSKSCDYFYWGERRVAGFLRRGVYAFYKGRHIYISKSQCAGKSKETHRSKVLCAMRNVVDKQIADYRKGYNGNWICPLSGVNLRNLKSSEIHVDHYGDSFKYLVQDWMSKNRLDFKDIEVAGRAGRSRTIKCEQLKQSWYNYHLEHAKLQLTSAKANLKKGARRD